MMLVRRPAGFNPRAHAGRDAKQMTYMSRDNTFQSTRPRGARRLTQQDAVQGYWFQSTRPRGARRVELLRG